MTSPTDITYMRTIPFKERFSDFCKRNFYLVPRPYKVKWLLLGRLYENHLGAMQFGQDVASGI